MIPIEDIETFVDELRMEDPGLVELPGMQDAIVGLARFGPERFALCYDYDTCVDILIEAGLTEEQAGYRMFEISLDNSLGLFGETPVFIERLGES